ncbi:hypothetical protein CSC26_5414 [Pseudomonas aeruginosa]|nr:hypothetical protein CSB90_5446 [Pseudomonas aeruginosa]AWF02319.1 hypothetical protein CSC26_5414 [Pseudomonas aeruginosa]RAL82828.1 hypothetical protein CSC34_5331 [Pseudomonas aeruginosa]
MRSDNTTEAVPPAGKNKKQEQPETNYPRPPALSAKFAEGVRLARKNAALAHS